ncbi:hypothetical protein E2C01_079402 [Portunus trituberculatus]|uniref:Uncharacterized protein n=1 Tax=Portunus trituberculatus TaxID=210409 RepID=A0A5B7ITA2_PORTR|nr:hypothetical protein [Portunus trituberculatus]
MSGVSEDVRNFELIYGNLNLNANDSHLIGQTVVSCVTFLDSGSEGTDRASRRRSNDRELRASGRSPENKHIIVVTVTVDQVASLVPPRSPPPPVTTPLDITMKMH